MDVWEEDRYPWLRAEKAAIREAVRERHMPVLGVCLGAQLLAEALGGRVGPMAEPEVGVMEVELTVAGSADPLFAGIAPVHRCLQWHGAEVKEIPAHAQVLASSPASAVQAFRVGEAAYGIQYHLELTRETVPEWGALPTYRESLEETMGAGALDRLRGAREADRHLKELKHDAQRLYDNFMRLVHPAPGT